MLLHLLNTGLDQLDEWYSWCGLQHTFDLIPYYDLDLLYVLHRYALVLILVLNGAINHHVVIITTIVIPFHQLITEARIVQSMQTRPASLIWFWWQIQIPFRLINKATVVLYWRLGYYYEEHSLIAWRRICERGLEWIPYIEHDLDRLDSLLYMY
jgi:hypothetical protein